MEEEPNLSNLGEPEHVESDSDMLIAETVLQYEAQHPINLSISGELPRVFLTRIFVKDFKVTVRVWTDLMKLELLREYIKKAEDLL